MAHKPYIEIIFASGAKIEFEATKLTTKRSPLYGELASIEWDGATNAPQYIKLENIDSIRFVQP